MEKYEAILIERFSKDSLLALATVDDKGIPWVRLYTTKGVSIRLLIPYLRK